MKYLNTPVIQLSLACACSVLLAACGAVEKTDNDLSQNHTTPTIELGSTSVKTEAQRKQDLARLASEQQISKNQVLAQQAIVAKPGALNDSNKLVQEKKTSLAKHRAKEKQALAYEIAPASVAARSAPHYANADAIMYQPEENRENYHHFKDSSIFKTSETAVSTFSVDVDTGSYSNVRRFLNQGQMPQKDAVRAEELINYFSYDYQYPENRQQPFTINTEIAPSPWNKHSHLLHIGLQAYKSQNEARPASNLVFLVDVSGSMQSRDKLQLLKSGLKLLVKQLNKNDRLSIVSYAGSTGVVLKPTKGDQTAQINMALDKMMAGGSTNGASGIKLAYQMAQQSYIKDGVNRIVLATDGDFNVGITNFESLKQMVEEKRKTGVSLTTLGFGRGNYNDHLMEQLADAGNGNYSYIDNLNEARKVLVEEMNSTLNTVASDVKIQIEFNPAQVAEYRLIGYENRALNREDFNNDKVDAGDIGENHTVTALYEITFTQSAVKQLDNNRYTANVVLEKRSSHNNELAFLRLRYKASSQAASQLIEKPLFKSDVLKNIEQTSKDFKFSAAVAAFAQQLRGGKYLQKFDYDDILELARKAKGEDGSGYRGEFIQLVSLAQSLDV